MMSTLRRENPLSLEKELKNVSKTRLVFANAMTLASLVPWVPETFLARFSRFFLAASAYGRRCVGLWPTTKIPAAREKNLWYPGY